jgi:hypothetical protein
MHKQKKKRKNTFASGTLDFLELTKPRSEKSFSLALLHQDPANSSIYICVLLPHLNAEETGLGPTDSGGHCESPAVENGVEALGCSVSPAVRPSSEGHS